MRQEARKTVEKQKEELAQKFEKLRKKGKITKEDLVKLNLNKTTTSVGSNIIIEVPENETNEGNLEENSGKKL